MGKQLGSGKRPGAKLKVMAKLGENIYGTTKIYRMIQAREDHLGMQPAAKWLNFLGKTSEEYNAFREWWKSPQSSRWKKLQPHPRDSSSE